MLISFICWLICLFLLSVRPLISLFVSPTLASSSQHKRSRWEGRRLRGRVLGRSVSNTLSEVRWALHGTPSAKHTSKPVCALVLSTFWGESRGEERGWSCLWAALGLLLSAAPVTVPFKPCSYNQIAYVLAALPHIFHFHPILATFIPLTSHFLHRFFWLLFCFPFELSAIVFFFVLFCFCFVLCVRFGGCAALPCVLLAGVSGGAKGIASDRPVTCKVHLNLWRTSPLPHGWQLFREKMLVWLRYVFWVFFLFFFLRLRPILPSIPFATLHEQQNPTFLLTCKLFFVCLRSQRVLFGQKCQRAEINCLYLFLFAAVGVWPYNGTTNRHRSPAISVLL